MKKILNFQISWINGQIKWLRLSYWCNIFMCYINNEAHEFDGNMDHKLGSFVCWCCLKLQHSLPLFGKWSGAHMYIGNSYEYYVAVSFSYEYRELKDQLLFKFLLLFKWDFLFCTMHYFHVLLLLTISTFGFSVQLIIQKSMLLSNS